MISAGKRFRGYCHCRLDVRDSSWVGFVGDNKGLGEMAGAGDWRQPSRVSDMTR